MPLTARDQLPRDFSRPAAASVTIATFAMVARQLLEADATTVATGQPHMSFISFQPVRTDTVRR